MKKTLPLMILAITLGCGKPVGSPSTPKAPAKSAAADANHSTTDKVADSLKDISETIRNVQTLSENVKNIKGLQLVPQQFTWEYKIINPADKEITLETRLNTLGQEGWELTGSTPQGNLILKRRQKAGK